MYADFMNGHMAFLRKYIWKLKIPLTIKIFMWFLYKKVILMMDDLVKRNWKGCKKYAFCDSEESIHHIFIACHFTLMIWIVVQFTYNITPPANITNMVGNWFSGIGKDTKTKFVLGCLR